MSPEVLEQSQYTATVDEDTFSGYILTHTINAFDHEGKILSVDCEHTIVEWITPIFEDLCRLLSLPPNWDSYGAPQIEKQSIVMALEILVLRPYVTSPSVTPTSHGGIHFEWRTEGIELEIEIGPWGSGEIYYEGPSGDPIEWEGNLKVELGFIKQLMDKLPRHK